MQLAITNIYNINVDNFSVTGLVIPFDINTIKSQYSSDNIKQFFKSKSNLRFTLTNLESGDSYVEDIKGVLDLLDYNIIGAYIQGSVIGVHRIDSNTLKLLNIVGCPATFYYSIFESRFFKNKTCLGKLKTDSFALDVFIKEDKSFGVVTPLNALVHSYNSYLINYRGSVYTFKELYKLLVKDGIDLSKFDKIYFKSKSRVIELAITPDCIRFITKLVVLER